MSDALDTHLRIHWIDNQAKFDTAMSALRQATVIGVDTEFVRRKTYYAEAGLIQLAVQAADGVDVYLLDCLAKTRDGALSEVLTNSDCVKVFHSVGEDLEVLRERFGVVPAPLFDTQVAASFAGIGNMMSLSKLVEQQLGVLMDKGETTSDWLQRPLRPEQIQYAAIDVQVLLPLYQLLRDQLVEKNRLSWLQEDCARAAAKAMQSNDMQPHHRLHGVQRFDQAQQVKLWKLMHWRQKRAMEKNLPKTWILDNPVLMEVAKQNILSQRSLQNVIESVNSKFARRADDIWPMLEDLSPPAGFELAPNLDKAQMAAYKEWRSFVDQRAAEIEIDAQLLANRRMLEQRVLGQAVPEFQGWRGEIFGAGPVRVESSQE
jgi:ribonuclease D